MLRLGALDIRPMHCDEAVHAIKFGALLEQGEYRYDPYEYHGPTLNYFSLVWVRLAGVDSIESVRESHLRAVPAAISLVLVLLPFFARKKIGTFCALWVSFLFAVSPSIVFYSRYYIQEMLLVTSTGLLIFAGFGMLSTGRLRWALLAGLGVGLMHASKETCIIAFGCAVLALAAVLLFTGTSFRTGLNARMIRNFAVLLLIAAAVSFLFHSSFFKYPSGFFDSLRTYSTYFNRASESVHLQPWYYYFRIFGWFQIPGGPRFSEGVIFVLALLVPLLGFRLRGRPNPVILFHVLFVTFMLIVYCMIPYKTPWSFLTVFSGMIFLAGVGIGYLFEYLQRFKRPLFRMVWIAVMAMVGLQLFMQSMIVNFVLHSSPQNPYVYSHPTVEVFALSDRIHEIKSYPGGSNLPVQVIAGDSDYWPLPWYLRDLKSVGWLNCIPADFTPAPVVVAAPDLLDDIITASYAASEPGEARLYRLLEEDYDLRPGHSLSVLITDELYRAVYEMAPVVNPPNLPMENPQP